MPYMNSKKLSSKTCFTTKLNLLALLAAISSGCNTAENSTTTIDSMTTTDEKFSTSSIVETNKNLSAPQPNQTKSDSTGSLKLSLPQDFTVENNAPKNSMLPKTTNNFFEPTNQNTDKVKINAKPMTKIDKNDLMNSRIEGGTLSVEIKTD